MAAKATKKETGNILLRMHPVQRIFISIGLAALSLLFTMNEQLTPLVSVMLLWDVFALSYILLCLIVLFRRSIPQIRQYARQEDGSRAFVFAIIVLASFASMMNVLLLIISKDATTTQLPIYLPVSVAGMLLSWMVVHITFAFHYAHMYYDDDDNDKSTHAGGLDFPEEDKPDYLDFAYFSFVIGMTFQVSDVEVSSRTIRRLVLLHGLISFCLNTFVVALTINLIAGLKK